MNKVKVKPAHVEILLNDPVEIHRLMKPILKLAQFFGIMPLSNFNNDINSLTFKIYSIKFVYTTTILISLSIYTIFVGYHTFSYGRNVFNFGKFVIIFVRCKF